MMEKADYTTYVFADSKYSDEYGLPKLHIRTYRQHINSDWITVVPQLQMLYGRTGVLPNFNIPDELKQLDSLRELSKNEIGILEAAILGCPFKN